MGRRKKLTRGFGRVFQAQYRDRYGVLKTSPNWMLAYYVDGQEIRESSDSADYATAVDMLRQRQEAAGRGEPVGPKVSGTTFADMKELIVDNYKKKGNKSIDVLVTVRLPHLEEHFGGWKASAITSQAIEKYQIKRLDSGAAPATINREIATLRRMFRLALKFQRVGFLPAFEMMKEDNVRKGFFEEEQLALMLDHIHPDLKNLLEIAFITGWRVESELLTRKWSHVDFDGGVLRLDVGEAKDATTGREFPFVVERLRTAFEDQRKRVEGVERKRDRIIQNVFIWTTGSHAGQRIARIDVPWNEARTKSGVDRIPHDFRRTAVRNLTRAGVPRQIAMQMVGHKTESIYRRYAIVDKPMIDLGGASLNEYFKEQRAKPKKVVAMRKPA
jgi:integrase